MIEAGRTTTYGYDALYRLTSEAITGDAHGNNGAIGYTLDKVGNRQARTSNLATIAPQSGLTYNARDWVSGDTYDANGSTLTSSAMTALHPEVAGTDTYDFEGRLIVRTKPDGSRINLSYDADGNRIGKTLLDLNGNVTASTSYLVDTNNLTGYAQVVEERLSNATGLTLRTYTYGNQLLSRSESVNSAAAITRYYTFDGHGNVRELTDASGAVTDRYDYDAFGNLILRLGATANAYLYCGEQFDADLGLYYLRARYLNTDSGRFWSMDDYEGNGSDRSSLHKYGYTGGNPVTGIDPSGNLTLAQVAVTAGVVGVLAKIAVPTLRRMGFNKTADFADALGDISLGLSMLITANAVAVASPVFATYMATRGADYMATGLWKLFSGHSGGGTFGAELIHEFTGLNVQSAEFVADLPMLIAGVAELGKAVGAALQARTLDVFQRLKNLLNSADEIEGSVSGGVSGAAENLGANGSTQAQQLARQLTSEEQMAQALAGQGTPMAGAGTSTVLRDSPRLVAQYGGDAADWAKMGTENSAIHGVRTPNGVNFEIHWYQNMKTGQIVELKPKIANE